MVVASLPVTCLRASATAPMPCGDLLVELPEREVLRLIATPNHVAVANHVAVELRHAIDVRSRSGRGR